MWLCRTSGADEPNPTICSHQRGEPPPAMSDENTFTERELDVMSILWRLGSGTVAEVRAELPGDPGYTSVLKFLQILEEKGHVRHEKEGRAHRYFPTVAAEEAGRSALGRVVDKIFHGSAELALARLVEERPLSQGELARMRRILDELEAREREDQ
ncbi:MAG: BlaI/MecI/CopY family transcriptional regulator [Gemmatimonadales bacterium]|nr:MAG: BlaI/MecI/CopY family transcriptional regulator [Gemmatimonadales bacterium]